jgi:hypothetical protein
VKRTPSDILKRHAIERHLRAAPRSARLDDDLSSGAPRMSEGAWVDSCALVAGVDPFILDVIGVRECHAAGWSVVVEAVEIQGEHHPIEMERVATPPTLAQAARKLGRPYPHAQLAAMRLDAIQRVTENLLRRGGGGETLSGAQEEASP